MTLSRFWIPGVISGAALCSVPFDLLLVQSYAIHDALQSQRSFHNREGLPAAGTPVLVAPAPVGGADPGATPDPLSPEGKSGRAWLEGSSQRSGVSLASSLPTRSKGVASLQGKSLDGRRKDGAMTSALRVPEWQRWTVTAYAHGCILPPSRIEGPPQRAADGAWPEAHWTVAADPRYPFGTVLELSHQGIMTTRKVGDRGGRIRGPHRADLFMGACEQARRWGVRSVDVRVVREPMGGTR